MPKYEAATFTVAEVTADLAVKVAWPVKSESLLIVHKPAVVQ